MTPSLAGALAGLVLAADPAPAYRLEAQEARRIEAVLTMEFQLAAPVAREWVVYAARAPELPGQVKVSTTMAPAGRPGVEASGRARPVISARVPAVEPALRGGITVTVTHRATLLSRRLVRVALDEKAAAVAPPKPAVRREALAEGGLFDFRSPEFKKWLKAKGLHKGKDDSDVDFAHEVFTAIRDQITYEYLPEQDMRASSLCRADRSDCGGQSVLFVSALRAYGVPARLLVGRRAESAKPGAKVGGTPDQQEHVTAEFFAAGVGWVPVDQSGGRFGEDAGNFLTLHVDTDLVIDAGPLGPRNVRWLQGVGRWAVGLGPMQVTTARHDWTVRELP
jgi:hypothetical protein